MEYHFASSRELFYAAKDAALDAERCRRQLDALEQRAQRIGSPSFEARVTGGDHDLIGRNVASLVDRERELEARVEQDYDLIDAACAVLYGRDGVSDGLASLMPPWIADAIYYRYLGLRKWDDVAELLMVSPGHIQKRIRVAFELMDSLGMARTVAGCGAAEG